MCISNNKEELESRQNLLNVLCKKIVALMFENLYIQGRSISKDTADYEPLQNFSKVSPLLHSLCKLTIARTFENLCIQGHSSVRITALILKRQLAAQSTMWIDHNGDSWEFWHPGTQRRANLGTDSKKASRYLVYNVNESKCWLLET